MSYRDVAAGKGLVLRVLNPPVLTSLDHALGSGHNVTNGARHGAATPASNLAGDGAVRLLLLGVLLLIGHGSEDLISLDLLAL